MTTMSGLFACVTSCIGGKDEKYAVKVKPIEHEVYFVYKTLRDFENLWIQLASLLTKQVEKEDSMMIQWLSSFVKHHSLRSLINQLETQQKETISTLNTFLQLLVRRVTAWYTETNAAKQLDSIVKNFLECTEEDQQLDQLESQRWKKRSFSEMRPEDELVAQRRSPSPLFPSRCNMDYFENRSPKFRRLSMMEENDCETDPLACLHKEYSSERCSPPTPPVASRRRVYAEVEFE